MTNPKNILKLRVSKVLPAAAGLEMLMASKKLRVYLGVDPTGARLHLGHAIGLRKLMEFAHAGHEAIFLFGTGTVMVGDPSQREASRKTISPAEIEANIKGWKAQAAKVVDFSKVQIKQNAEWLSRLTLKDLIGIASHISATQLFKRESFRRRLKAGDTVWYHETMYPLFQGYDSVAMDVDLEIGGSDQEFNMLMGRELQKKINKKDKYVMTLPLLLGADGKKMSTTEDNCIYLDDTPADMYGKVMSLPDELMDSYFELTTDLDADAVTKLKKAATTPRDVKARLAYEITKLYHGEAAAKKAAAGFDAQFKEGAMPEDITIVKLKAGEWQVPRLLVETGLASSASEARRLFEQGGVRLNAQVVVSPDVTIKSGDTLQVGKRHFAKIA